MVLIFPLIALTHRVIARRLCERTFSFTWVLRICWIRTNLKIQEHSMLYKLSPIQKRQETNLKMVKVNPGSSFEKKAPGHGHTSSRKIPFASLFYMIFCFISVMCTKPHGKRRQALGTIFWCKQKGLHVSKKIALPSDFMHIVLWFYTGTCT